jgi:hypothetical protein
MGMEVILKKERRKKEERKERKDLMAYCFFWALPINILNL